MDLSNSHISHVPLGVLLECECVLWFQRTRLRNAPMGQLLGVRSYKDQTPVMVTQLFDKCAKFFRVTDNFEERLFKSCNAINKPPGVIN